MLTDLACKNSHKSDKAKLGKPFKLSNSRGLFLFVSPTNSGWGKSWRLKYRFETREKLLTIGRYPEISLEQARRMRDDARRQLANGIDPGLHKKSLKLAKKESSAHSFEVIALEWLAKKCEDNRHYWLSEAQHTPTTARLQSFFLSRH